jgi:ParE toxin of type II toxin-antitoxin system, parDE
MKKYSLALLDIAKQDAKEIKHWYSSIRKELGKRFTADLKNTLFSIERLPTAYAIRYKNIRFANLDIFPYVVEFFIKEDSSIVVIAILYNGRDPKVFKEKSDLLV